MAEKILYLTLKKKWFDKIKSGEKKEEYRMRKPYWEARFVQQNDYDMEIKRFDWVCFRNGYGKKVPQIFVRWLALEVRTDINTGIEYFAIKLGEVKNGDKNKNKK